MSRVTFISVAIYFAKYQYEVGKRLEAKGDIVQYVTYSKEAAYFLKKQKCVVYYIPKCIHPPFYQDEEYIKKNYNVNCDTILLGDYDFSQMNKKKALQLMIGNFLFWDEYIKVNKPDIIIGSSERYVGMIPYYVSKKYNTQFMFWSRSAIPNMFWMSPYTLTGEIRNIHEAYTNSDIDTERAEKVINDIVSNKKNLYLVVGEPAAGYKELFNFIDRLFKNIFVENFKNPYARVISIAFEKLKRIYRSKAVKKFYSEPTLTRPYLFYPLHVPDDCQLLVRAPQYLDQYNLIKQIALSLPKGYELYVKEHPNNIGGLPVKMIKDISEIKNVRVVHYNTQSHYLIKYSTGVITINSTAGWEGLLYQKPVIALAKSFYSFCPHVVLVEDLSKLKSAITHALNSTIPKEDLIKLVNSVIKGSYEGSFNFYPGKESDSMKPENLDLIADGVSKELNRKVYK